MLCCTSQARWAVFGPDTTVLMKKAPRCSQWAAPSPEQPTNRWAKAQIHQFISLLMFHAAVTWMSPLFCYALLWRSNNIFVIFIADGSFIAWNSFRKSRFVKQEPKICNCFSPCRQNGLVNVTPEMFRLRSCVRRKRDSIDKRFCFDIEVVERWDRKTAERHMETSEIKSAECCSLSDMASLPCRLYRRPTGGCGWRLWMEKSLYEYTHLLILMSQKQHQPNLK